MCARKVIPTILSVFAVLVGGCTVDYRKQLAYNLLYKPDGFEEDKAFSAVVAARFPPGSSASTLRQFATRNDGECRSKDPNGLVCEIVTRAQFCAARWLRIEATLDGETILSINTLSTGAGC